MKLATYRIKGRPRLGAVIDADSELVDLRAVAERLGLNGGGEFNSMLDLIDGDGPALEAAQTCINRARADEVVPLASARLLAPLPVPRSMRDCLVFEEHMLNAMKAVAAMQGREPSPIPPVWYKQPIYYKGNRFSVIGTETDVKWPSYSQVMDYELELACIVGRSGRDIPRERAMEHVFGFTIFNDCSARDAQAAEMAGTLGPAKGKDFDTGNVLGPWIVTADEIGDPHDLKMEVRVNGERRGGGNSSGMHHKFADILAFISRDETLYAGEVIGSGTVGTGCGLEIGRFPQEGDVVELEIEKIGVLRNRFTR